MESGAVWKSFLQSGKRTLSGTSDELILGLHEPGMLMVGSNCKQELSNAPVLVFSLTNSVMPS